MYLSKKILAILISFFLISGLIFYFAGCGKDETKPTAPSATVIGKSLSNIDTRMVVTRTQETGIGNLIADAMREKHKNRGVQLAFMNGGSIRAGAFDYNTMSFVSEEARKGKIYPAGDITDVMVKEWIPFGNVDWTLSITARQLKIMLERSVSSLPPDLAKDEGGWFLNISGGRFWVDCSKTAQVYDKNSDTYTTQGERISKIMVDTTVIYDVATGGWKVDSTATKYTIVTTSFIAAGNDGYAVLKEPGITKTDTGVKDVDTVMDYIKAHTPVNPVVDTTNRRITVIGGCDHAYTQP